MRICLLYCEKPSEIGLFSKLVTLRICKVVWAQVELELLIENRDHHVYADGHHAWVFTAFSEVP